MKRKHSRAKRAVIYARCSTAYEQNPEVQLQQLRLYCNSRGWSVTKELVDQGYSGASTKRPGLVDLLTLVRRRDVDVVCVVKLDRIFRSLKDLLGLLTEFEDLSCEFVSIGDQIDLTTASGRLHVQLLGAFAQFERDLIRARTMAGLDHARKLGKRLGRPALDICEQVTQLREQGLTYRQIQLQLSCSASVITRILKSAPKSPQKITKNNQTKANDYKGDK